MLFSVSSLTITDHYCTCSHLFYIPKLLILWHLKCYVYVAVTSQFCDFMSLCCLVGLSGRVVLILLDYVICVPLCSRLISILEKQKEWAEICTILSEFTRFTFICSAGLFMTYVSLILGQIKKLLQTTAHSLKLTKCMWEDVV